MYRWVAASGRLACLNLLGVLEVAAVRKADRQVKALGLPVEMLVVGVRIDPAEDRVLRLALAAIRTRFRSNR